MSANDRIREIDREITLLKYQRHQILMDEIKAFQNEHRQNIGRCFRSRGGRCVIITGVPGVGRSRDFVPNFNQYQFPALVLERMSDDETVIPFSDDTIFSRNGVDFGGDPITGDPNYQEISFEEFMEEFEKRVKTLRAIITTAHKQEEQ